MPSLLSLLFCKESNSNLPAVPEVSASVEIGAVAQRSVCVVVNELLEVQTGACHGLVVGAAQGQGAVSPESSGRIRVLILRVEPRGWGRRHSYMQVNVAE